MLEQSQAFQERPDMIANNFRSIETFSSPFEPGAFLRNDRDALAMQSEKLMAFGILPDLNLYDGQLSALDAEFGDALHDMLPPETGQERLRPERIHEDGGDTRRRRRRSSRSGRGRGGGSRGGGGGRGGGHRRSSGGGGHRQSGGDRGREQRGQGTGDGGRSEGDNSLPESDGNLGGSDSGELQGRNNAEKAFNYLVGKGLTTAQAAGIVGNLIQENANLDPRKPGDGGNSVGIAQWNGPRRRDLMNYASEQGRSPYELRTQLDFMWHELNGKERRALNGLRNTSTPEQAALSFSRLYERPGNPMNENRIRNAEMAFNTFGRNTSNRRYA